MRLQALFIDESKRVSRGSILSGPDGRSRLCSRLHDVIVSGLTGACSRANLASDCDKTAPFLSSWSESFVFHRREEPSTSDDGSGRAPMALE